jgi:glucose/arabinose dehydrogenase/PKD repeat protein
LGRTLTCALAAAVACASAAAQASQSALRFYGTGSNQQDRVRIAIDDDAPGPDASAPCDVGAGGFTIEFWLRGNLASNPTANAGGDVLLHGADWRAGNIVVDRGILGDSERQFGVSIAGGFVRFGTGGGDGDIDHEHSLEGNVNVLDDAWHHVACVREVQQGTTSIYVDGVLDMQSEPAVSTVDLSYPNDGVRNAPPGPTWNNYLVLGAAKHDLGPNEPSFSGWFDELRVWNVARTAQEIALTWRGLVPRDTPGLVANYRFEEGGGAVVRDVSFAHSPDGELIAGTPGDGEWTSAASDPTSVAPLVVTPLPPGFSMTVLSTALPLATSIAAAPDGRLFVGELDGKISVLSNGQVLPQPLIEIPAGMVLGSRGLLGLCVDPSFSTNGWLYVYYTTLEPRNRVSRFTVAGNRASPASEFVVWQNVNTTPGDHNGGGLEFAADGKLLISTGDQFISNYASDLSREDGKLLRLNPDGTIPSDNPFVGVPNAAPTLFAIGLRNPFRMCTDATNERRWIGDVGGNGTLAWEELDMVESGANYGWPSQEGQSCYVSSCAAFKPSVYQYQHGDPNYYFAQPQGSIIAGVVYRANVFPEQYRGNVFVGDYANNWLRRLVLDDNGDVIAELPFIETPNAPSVVDMDVGLDGALYLACFTGLAGQPSLIRVDATANGNLPPVPIVSATPKQGVPPLAVSFDGIQSFDPDGGPSPLAFDWNFGDGAHASSSRAQHTYTSPGVYTASLALDDGANVSTSTPIAIQVGTPPVPVITAPLAGASYIAGDVVQMIGQATDAEDGPLAPSALSWRVELVHGGHTHPFVGPIPGVAQTSFTVPASGHPPEDTHFRVLLTATDSNGLNATSTVDMSPTIAVLAVDTQPSGVPVFIEGQAEATPRNYQSIPGFQVLVEAQRWTNIANEPWLFRSWSDGGARVHTVTTPASGEPLVATYTRSLVETFRAPVSAVSRHAQYSTSTGQLFASPTETSSLWVGKQNGEKIELALEFAAPIPHIATILSAKIEFVAGDTNVGHAQIPMFAYDVASAPAFVAGSSTSLSSWAPTTSATYLWDAVQTVAGQQYDTPDLSPMLQEVVDRADWHSGGYVGIVLNGTTTFADTLRSMRNLSSGTPPRLIVTYAVRRNRTTPHVFGG